MQAIDTFNTACAKFDLAVSAYRNARLNNNNIDYFDKNLTDTFTKLKKSAPAALTIDPTLQRQLAAAINANRNCRTTDYEAQAKINELNNLAKEIFRQQAKAAQQKKEQEARDQERVKRAHELANEIFIQRAKRQATQDTVDEIFRQRAEKEATFTQEIQPKFNPIQRWLTRHPFLANGITILCLLPILSFLGNLGFDHPIITGVISLIVIRGWILPKFGIDFDQIRIWKLTKRK